MKNNFFVFIIFTLLSCEKEELSIPPHAAGDILTKQIEIGKEYQFQIFYDLGENTIISQNEKTDWDIAFESSEDGFHILLNSSTFSALSYIESVSFSDTISASNLIWEWDNPNGNLDSTAFGDYRDVNGFFILDLGYNINSSQRGFKKIIIDSVTTEYYKITYANLDNSNYNSLKIYKNPEVNFTSFSLIENNVVIIHPTSNEWDLVFSQYTHIFNDIETPAYLVTGVLSNYQVLVAEDTSYNFEEITYDIMDKFSFGNSCDIIGYDWKEYNFDLGSYTINSNITYLIKDRQQRYFKLRFIDYYNDLGDRGYPKFEIQEL